MFYWFFLDGAAEEGAEEAEYGEEEGYAWEEEEGYEEGYYEEGGEHMYLFKC